MIMLTFLGTKISWLEKRGINNLTERQHRLQTFDILIFGTVKNFYPHVALYKRFTRHSSDLGVDYLCIGFENVSNRFGACADFNFVGYVYTFFVCTYSGHKLSCATFGFNAFTICTGYYTATTI